MGQSLPEAPQAMTERAKRRLEFVTAVMLPLCVLSFVVSQRLGFWDWWFGLNHVERAVASFEKSYSPDASQWVKPGDPAWEPLMRLVNKYSIADLPKQRQPKMFARFTAVASSKLDIGQGQIAEWTAPTTPIALLYREWPGQTVPVEEYRVIGSISDLRTWISQSRDDFRFMVQDVFLSALSILLPLTIWLKQPSKLSKSGVKSR